jgi:peptidoglycan hydrolase CwlO-like protein
MPNPARRFLLAVPMAAIAFVTGATAVAPAQTSTLTAQKNALQARVNAETARLNATSAGVADAQGRLATINARVAQRTQQLRDAEAGLVRARARLSQLETRSALATKTLSANLVDSYKAGTPNIVNVVLDAHGFSDLLERLNYQKRVSRDNAQILGAVREARTEVAVQAKQLVTDRERYSGLAKAAMEDQQRADAIATALLKRQAEQLAVRNGTASQLASVKGKIERIAAAEAAAARRQAAASTATQQAPIVTGDPSGAVARVIAAANQIASTPYVWGGGHGGASGGYDCSGSVSYALAAAGLLNGSLTSGGFESWGLPGPGAHITVYANAGHAYMVVDGRRFDTSNLSGGGTRWTSVMRSSAGFVARHPPGL